MTLGITDLIMLANFDFVLKKGFNPTNLRSYSKGLLRTRSGTRLVVRMRGSTVIATAHAQRLLHSTAQSQ